MSAPVAPRSFSPRDCARARGERQRDGWDFYLVHRGHSARVRAQGLEFQVFGERASG